MAACPLQSLQAHALRASTSRRLRSQRLRRMTVLRQIGRAAGEEDDANESPTALAVGALFPVALFRRARADRRGERAALGAGSLAEPAGQARRSADGGGGGRPFWAALP